MATEDDSTEDGPSSSEPLAESGGGLDFSDLPQPDYEGTISADKLHVDGDNPNQMSDDMFGLLVDKMRQHGWLGGPIITDTDGLIADGEHRWRAAQEIGLHEVPVRQFDIDDAERRMWRQELNKIRGQHDKTRDALEYDLLLAEGKSDRVSELANAADEDLDKLLADLRPDSKRSPPYDYNIDPNVYYMDCVEGMREHLDDDEVDMIFTSPPYNIELQPGSRSTAWGDPDEHDESRVFYEDDRDWDEYIEWMGEVFDEMSRVTKPSGHIFFNINLNLQEGTATFPHWAYGITDLPVRSLIVWNKQTYTPGAAGMEGRGRFAHIYELIFHYSEEPSPLNGSKNTTVWNARTSNLEAEHDTGQHPAPFSTELVAKGISATTEPGDLVLDPFMGSGTTAVAAIEEGRDYIGFELDEEGAYAPTIERRIREALRRTNQLDPSHDDVTPVVEEDVDEGEDTGNV